LEVKERRRQRWGDLILFEDETKRVGCVPVQWTSFSAPDPFEVAAAGRSPFRPDDLLRVAGILEALKGPK
jgi:hypothetical protein